MVNEIVGGKFQRQGKSKMLRGGLKRRVKKIIDMAVRVLYIDVGNVFVVLMLRVFVAVQGQNCLFRRQNADKKQQQKIRYVITKCAHKRNNYPKIQVKAELCFVSGGQKFKR